jgi:UDP-glucose 4-epimerase
MNKVLIAGGLGFIGNVLAKEFLRNDWSVSIIDNETTYNVYEELLHNKKMMLRKQGLEDATIYDADIFNAIEINKIVTLVRPTVIINLANMPIASVAVEQPILASDTMIHGLLGLLEAAKNNTVSRFVNVSSSMVYGDFLTDPVLEDQSCNPREIYGNLKVAGERLVMSYYKLHNLPYTIIRPSACYGPSGNEAFVITKFLKEAISGGTIKIHGINTKLDFTYVTDIAHGIFLASTSVNAINETFNITCGHKCSLVEVAEILKDWYPKLSVITADANKLYPKRGQLSIEKAHRLIGYQPEVHINQGLELFNEWLLNF